MEDCMNYLDGKKCLDEILNAVTPEDEKMFFLNIEYLKNYNGAVIGPIHKDGFGNIFDVFLTKNIGSLDDLYTWNSFEEAKKKLEGQENPSSKCFSLKEGLRIGFEHEMVLSDCYPDTVFEPKWVSLYNEWVVQKNEYKRRFMTEEDLKQRSDFFLSIANGIQSAIEKHKV